MAEQILHKFSIMLGMQDKHHTTNPLMLFLKHEGVLFHRIRQNFHKSLIIIVYLSIFLCTEQKATDDCAGTVRFLNVCQVFG